MGQNIGKGVNNCSNIVFVFLPVTVVVDSAVVTSGVSVSAINE